MRRRKIKSVVKVCSLTVKLPLKLIFLSVSEVGGMCCVAVKCLDITQNTNCEAAYWDTTDAEARKRGVS